MYMPTVPAPAELSESLPHVDGFEILDIDVPTKQYPNYCNKVPQNVKSGRVITTYTFSWLIAARTDDGPYYYNSLGRLRTLSSLVGSRLLVCLYYVASHSPPLSLDPHPLVLEVFREFS
jgi:hypothetical protein